ncbi:hypothetical protein FQR65_LT19647 [Abscondita terminalis]|nr:hypothetical protein FQR65_LT19647 [Abscondita terminalis]
MQTNLPGLPLRIAAWRCFASARNILWEEILGRKHLEYLFDAQPHPTTASYSPEAHYPKRPETRRRPPQATVDYWVWKLENEEGGCRTDAESLGHPGEQKKGRLRKEDFWIIKLKQGRTTNSGAQPWGRGLLQSVVPPRRRIPAGRPPQVLQARSCRGSPTSGAIQKRGSDLDYMDE